MTLDANERWRIIHRFTDKTMANKATKTADKTADTPATPTPAPATNAPAYTLTEGQKTTEKSIQQLMDATKTAHGDNILKAVKDLEKYAQALSGSPNEEKRVGLISTLLKVSPDSLNKVRAGVTALGMMLAQRYAGQEIGEGLDVLKKEKEEKATEPTESETALQTVFASNVVASQAVKALNVDEINFVNAAAHAAFQSAIARLSSQVYKVGDKNVTYPFPRQAADFVSYLIGMSGGNTDWFDLSDQLICETQKVSPSTLKRGRSSLIDWMSKTGKGIVSIEQTTAKPTRYKVNLLESTTAIMHNLIQSETSNPESLYVVAGLTGKLLTEGTEKLQAKVSVHDFQAAQTMDKMITDATENLPAPVVSMSESANERIKQNAAKKFESLSENIGTAIEGADTLKMAKVSAELNQLALDTRKVRENFEANGGTVDFDSLEKRLSANRILINEESKRQAAEARQAAGEKAEAQTPKERAEGLVEAYAIPETLAEATNEYFDSYADSVWFLAAATAKDSDAGNKMFLRLQDTLNNAFQRGKHKPEGASN